MGCSGEIKVKICGIRDEQTAEAAVTAGASAVGLILCPGKRQIDVALAREIVRTVGDRARVVGVFCDAAVDEIAALSRAAGLDWVQLHGSEEPLFCRKVKQTVGLKVVKAFAVCDRLPEWERYIMGTDIDLVVVDAQVSGRSGGLGEAFDWELLRGRVLPRPFALAGGLTVENVRRAIKEVRPDWVDVSSGVEAKGQKDYRLIRQFIAQAQGED